MDAGGLGEGAAVDEEEDVSGRREGYEKRRDERGAPWTRHFVDGDGWMVRGRRRKEGRDASMFGFRALFLFSLWEFRVD